MSQFLVDVNKLRAKKAPLAPISARVPEDLKQWLVAWCEREKVELGPLVTELLMNFRTSWVAEHGPGTEPTRARGRGGKEPV